MSKKRKNTGKNSRDAPKGQSYATAWLCSPDAYKILCGEGYRSIADCPEVQMCVHAYADMISSMTIHLMQNTPKGDVRIKNESDRPRSLSVYGYVEFSFHHIDMDNQNFQMSLYACGSHEENGAVLFEAHYEEDSWQFFAGNFEPDGFDGVRDAGRVRQAEIVLRLERGRERDPHLAALVVCKNLFA